MRGAESARVVRVDPEVLKTVDAELPGELLREQLANDEHVLGRVEAARALGKKGDKDAIAALGKAAREDAFWGVQAEAARALGSLREGGVPARARGAGAAARGAFARPAAGPRRRPRGVAAMQELTESISSCIAA